MPLMGAFGDLEDHGHPEMIVRPLALQSFNPGVRLELVGVMSRAVRSRGRLESAD